MNSLHLDLKEHDVIVLKERSITGTTSELNTRLLKVHAGNGLLVVNMGRSIFGYMVGHPSIPGDQLQKIDGMEHIERMATPEEVMRATKK